MKKPWHKFFVTGASAGAGFHDPCQLVRRGGIIDAPRKLLNRVSKRYVEMEDHEMDLPIVGLTEMPVAHLIKDRDNDHNTSGGEPS